MHWSGPKSVRQETKDVSDKHWAFKPRKFQFKPHGGAGAPGIDNISLSGQDLVCHVTSSR